MIQRKRRKITVAPVLFNRRTVRRVAAPPAAGGSVHAAPGARSIIQIARSAPGWFAYLHASDDVINDGQKPYHRGRGDGYAPLLVVAMASAMAARRVQYGGVVMSDEPPSAH